MDKADGLGGGEPSWLVNFLTVLSHYIPVFAYPLDPRNDRESWSVDEALAAAPPLPWSATSRNWWFQGFLGELLDLFAGHDSLRYLLEDLALVPADETFSRAQDIGRLLAAFRADPELFLKRGSSYISSPDQVAVELDQAQVLRSLDDDSSSACSNFFSYLLSQAAALEEAAAENRALLYVRPMPD